MGSFLRKDLDISPQVTLMSVEIQEQHGLMKTYEITVKKLEGEVEPKDYDVASLKNQLNDIVAFNKLLEKRLNSSGSLSMFDSLQFTINIIFHPIFSPRPRSIHSLVRLMIIETDNKIKS
jgi:hypothetical protein